MYYCNSVLNVKYAVTEFSAAKLKEIEKQIPEGC